VCCRSRRCAGRLGRPRHARRVLAGGGFGCGDYQDFRCILTHANRQPAVANCVRRPGDSEYRALAVDVLRIEDEAVAEIITFGPDVLPRSGCRPS
jgi:hypothetical protein